MTTKSNNVNCVNCNGDDAQRFISILAGDSPVTFQTFDDNKERKDGGLTTVLHGTLTEHLPELMTLNALGAGVFVMVNQGDLQGRSANNVIAVRALFLDLDGASLEPVSEAPLEPHLIVETSPGRYHVYWKIDGLNLNDFRQVQSQLAAKLGGDGTVKDLPRVMRLPGFFHNKNEPFPVRLLEAREAAPYDAEAFLEAFEINMETHVSVSGTTRTSEIIPRLRLTRNHRHNTLLSIAGFLRKRGLESEQLNSSLQVFNSTLLSPPLSESEVRALALDVAYRYQPGLFPQNRTEVGMAEEFCRRYGHVLRYCDELGGWLIWDNSRWVRDFTGEVMLLAKELIRTLLEQARSSPESEQKGLHIKFLTGCERKARLDAIMALSKCELPARAEDFDTDNYLLNLPNGTLDLRTGVLSPHRPTDYISKIAGVQYDPDATCPIWLDFLDKIFDGNQELIGFVKRALGYSLTGDTREQCWFLLYGTGANGKTTLIKVVQYVLGDYAISTSADTFLRKFGDGPRNDIARLRGARFIAASEPDSSKRLAESVLKNFTGEDKVTCRFLWKEEFDYEPNGKLFIAANHLPTVSENDHGFWRRIREIPFEVTIPESEQDKQLLAKLKAEASGILNWMIAGCLEWQSNGLKAPRIVTDATSNYRDEMDAIADFLAEPWVVVAEGWSVQKTVLYEQYVTFCEDTKLKPLSIYQFSRAMKAEGFKDGQVGKDRKRCWLGIGLRNDVVKKKPQEMAV